MKAAFIIFMMFLSMGIAMASPVLFFSDMTDGVISGGGWGGAQAGKGAAVTIWGDNFGTERGTSSVTVCGVTLDQDDDFAEWGATTNPQTARGLQRITFWLSGQMQTGPDTIRVTTPDGNSQEIPFYCRDTGNIYFVKPDGDDNLDGLTDDTAWATPGKARATLEPGDVAYFRAGTWEDKDAGGGFTEGIMSFYGGNYNNGQPDNSITVASYPGEVAVFDAYTDSPSSTPEYCFGNDFAADQTWRYWTFSKFRMNSEMHCFLLYGELGGGAGPYYFSNIRVVGNDMSSGYGKGGTVPIEILGGQEGSTDLFIYGNYVHDLGVNYRGQGPITSSRHYPIYVTGYGQWDEMYIGWNEFGWVEYGRGAQIYGHLDTDRIDNCYFHDNYIHDVSMNCLTFGGTDHGEKLVENFYVYNNIFDMSGGSMSALLCNGESYFCYGKRYVYNNVIYQGTSTSSSMIFFHDKAEYIELKNNIFYSSGASYFSGASQATKIGSNNCYYNGANIPSWDTGSLENTDPQFVGSDPQAFGDFHLKETSPAIDSGTSDVSSIVAYDFDGNPRPMDGDGNGSAEYDIGAYEYTGEYIPPEYYCGDGLCHADENCSDCPEDCGDCPVQCVNEADKEPCDGCIDNDELFSYISLWKASGSVTMPDLMESISLWKEGCG